MEFALQYPNGHGDWIQLGMCGDADLTFLRSASIRWPELTTTILRERARRGADPWPEITEIENRSSGPHPDQANQQPGDE